MSRPRRYPRSPRLPNRGPPSASGDPELERELEALFPRTLSTDSQELHLLSIHPPWKRQLHALLEHPTSSSAAFAVHMLVTTTIVFSAGVTVLETISFFHSTAPSVWFGIETSVVALFTVEYVVRAVAWSASWSMFMSWFLSFFGIIDLLAILPYYIEILLQLDTSVMFRFSILRTFRLLRVFRAFRSNNTILLTIEVMFLSVKRSQHALLALGFFVCMFLVIFSTILYFVERGTWDPVLEMFIDADGDPSQFSSIPAAAWFVLITITTVGYGEITPRSFLGRLITVPLLVVGLLMIALPSFVLGREFSKVWDSMYTRELEGVEMDERRSHARAQQADTSELSRQIADLQGALDAQSQMLRRLMDVLEVRSSPNLRPRASAVNGRYSDASDADVDIASVGARANAKGKGKEVVALGAPVTGGS